MNKLRLFSCLCLLELFLAVSGCSTIGDMAGVRSSQWAPIPDQSIRIENTDMCRIYLIRQKQMAGAAVSELVTEDHKVIGKIGYNSYLCWERPPGIRTIAVRYFTGTKCTTVKHKLDAKAGRSYYLQFRTPPSLFGAGLEVELFDQDKGKKLLKNSDPPRPRGI